MADAGDLQARLDAVRADFIADLSNRAAALRGLWADLQENGWQAEPLQEFHRRVHSLTGAGATFGFTELSACARTLEEGLLVLLQGDGVDGRERIPALFAELLAAIAAAADANR